MPMALNVENTEDLQGLTDIFDEEAAIMIGWNDIEAVNATPKKIDCAA